MKYWLNFIKKGGNLPRLTDAANRAISAGLEAGIAGAAIGLATGRKGRKTEMTAGGFLIGGMIGTTFGALDSFIRGPKT